MSKEPKYKYSKAFNLIASMEGDIRVVQGGKGSSKTISILQIFILLAVSNRENLILSVVAESLPNLKTGALRDFEMILRDMGLYDQFNINRTDRTYTYGTNTIEFFSVMGQESRLGSRRTHLYINEATGLTLDTFIELQGRTSEFSYLDYNPSFEFWVHEHYIGQPNVGFLQLWYIHNQYIPAKELASIMDYKRRADETKSPYWVNKWRVLGLGELGVVDGVIFEEGNDWEVVERVPDGARYLGAGLDFGFTHVTAIMKLYEYDDPERNSRAVVLKQALFKESMTAQQIAKYIMHDSELMDGVIVADSARPEMIREIASYRIPIISHRKNLVQEGLDLMHQFWIMITADSVESIEEFRQYAYAKNRQGQSLGVPNKKADVDNAPDAARYAFEYFLSNARKLKNGLKWVR
jgi:phage terminase large subunit|tara:strand:- start:1714 stop:2940 length:1227 start_codon:yes stop_codon:yes gene_type:complete